MAFAVAGLFLFSHSASAAYYVDVTNGSDSNNGLAQTDQGGGVGPWKTISKVNSATLSAGSTVSFKRGEIWRATTGVFSDNTLTTYPETGITYNAYGIGADPIISGAKGITAGSWTLTSVSTYQATLTVNPSAVYENSTTQLQLGSGSGSLTAGQYYWAANVLYVRLSDSSSPITKADYYVEAVITAENLWVCISNGNTYQNITFTKATIANFKISCDDASNITINSCTLSYSGKYGIYLNMGAKLLSNITISNNTISQFAREYYFSGVGAGVGEAGIFKNGNGAATEIAISDNIISSYITATDTNGFRNGIHLSYTQGAVVEGNEITATDHAIYFDTGSTAQQVYNNYVHDTGDDCIWYISGDSAVKTYNNLCINNKDDCFDHGYNGNLGSFYNNTCVNPYSVGIEIKGNASGAMSFYNNIFYFNSNTPSLFAFATGSTPLNYTINNNLYYYTQGKTTGFLFNVTDENFATWQGTYGKDSVGKYGLDPLLNNIDNQNLTLNSTSPAIDAGIDLNLSTDYAGNSRYDMPSITNDGSVGSYTKNYVDIGAYEYITPPDSTLSCSTHSSESTWYNTISPVTMTFSSPYDTALKATTTDFKYLINQTLAPTIATVKAGTALDDLVTFNAADSITADGTWYVHAIAQNEATTTVYSSNYNTYTIKYDATSPSVFISSPTNNNPSSSQPTFIWSGSDATSGISKYQLYIDGILDTDNITGTSAAPANSLSCSAHTWYVKAIDNAGNSANSSTYNLASACGGVPVWFFQMINQQNQPPTPVPVTGGIANITPGNYISDTIEQIIIEAKIIDLYSAGKIAEEAGKEKDIKKEESYKKIAEEKIIQNTNINSDNKEEIINFIVYGTQSTKKLGEGERAGVVNSYKSSYGKLPATEAEWNDVIKIANGRWPSEKNIKSEANASNAFEKIYKRKPNKFNKHDDAAITIMAYGLRPANKSLNSEQAAIKIFKSIYKYEPKIATAWDVVRAIAYSGAKR